MSNFKHADYRIAVPGDADSIAALLSRCRISSGAATENAEYFLAQKNGRIAAFLLLFREPEQGLCKIHRICVDTAVENAEAISREIILFAVDCLKNSATPPDVLYTTTRALTLKQQEFTLDIGFKILGIFPNAPGADESWLNGLTAYYFDGVLPKKRYKSFSLHPSLAPFYAIAAEQCALEKLPAYAEASADKSVCAGYLQAHNMEPINAPQFVAGRFELLKKKKSLSVSFYPFQKPNLLITNPDQTIEIFCKTAKETRFAAIIAERIAAPANPAELYGSASAILNGIGMNYIEVINDAADVLGIECILKAGYVPCAYFPCLKKHGKLRRDYAVFSKSFEKIFIEPVSGINETYKRYLAAYRMLEK